MDMIAKSRNEESERDREGRKIPVKGVLLSLLVTTVGN